jgi:hypothetical protein
MNQLPVRLPTWRSVQGVSSPSATRTVAHTYTPFQPGCYTHFIPEGSLRTKLIIQFYDQVNSYSVRWSGWVHSLISVQATRFLLTEAPSWVLNSINQMHAILFQENEQYNLNLLGGSHEEISRRC